MLKEANILILKPTSADESAWLAQRLPNRKPLGGRYLLPIDEGNAVVRDLVAAGFPDEGDLDGAPMTRP